MEKEVDMTAGSFSFIAQPSLQGHGGMITHSSMDLMVFIIMMGIYTGKCWHVPQGKVPFCYLRKLDPYGGGLNIYQKVMLFSIKQIFRQGCLNLCALMPIWFSWERR